MAEMPMQDRSTGTESVFNLNRRSAAMAGTRYREASADDGSGQPAAPVVAGWLSLAAAPTFAIMALVSCLSAGSRVGMICSARRDMSPQTGMVTMYALMSVFHLAPWFRLLSTGRGGVCPS